MTHRSTDSETPLPRENYDPVVLKISSNIKLKLSQLRYITFSLIGIALLWPWNAFLSASAYYGERFSHSLTLVKIYSSTMMTVSTLTSTCYNYYLSQVQKGVNYNSRVNVGLLLTVIVFIFMAITCISMWFITMKDIVFYVILMLMVLLSSAATCLAQNGTMAIVNVLGGIYANAVMVGQAVAGVLPAIALIISILVVGEKTKDELGYIDKDYGVFVYYITASLVSLASMALLWWVNVYKVHTQYRLLDETLQEPQSIDEEVGEEEPIVQQTYVPFGALWSKLKYIVMTIFLTFGITLIFPVFASTVVSVNSKSDFRFFKKDIFIPFIYVIWNLGDLLGRIFCGTPGSRFLINDPRKLVLFALLRLTFIPLFLTCNTKELAGGESSALINSASWYIMLQFLFGLTNGQLSTSSFMIVGDFCDTDDEKEAAGGFTTVFLSLGLAVGSVFSYLLVLLIN